MRAARQRCSINTIRSTSKAGAATTSPSRSTSTTTTWTSDSVHLPPTEHLFMQAAGVYVMNFLPKPAEGVPGTERTPWYHRNVDYDEIAFFHGGSPYGIPMPPGLISHAPQGVHHGAPEKARERAR